MCNRIIEETIRPAFRQGNFYGGIDAALEQMMRLIQGEPLPPPDRGWHPGERSHGGGPLPIVLFAVLAGSVVLRGIFGRTLGSALTGAGAGLLVFLAGSALALALLAAAGGLLFSPARRASRGRGRGGLSRGGGVV